MAAYGPLAAISLLGFTSALAESPDNQEPASRTAFDGDKPEAWLFPVESLNHALPPWLQFGGEYRSRIESEDGIKYTTTNDIYLLSRFRFNAKIQPTKWLTFFGETQDSRVFFNHHVPDALPYQNTWDIRQAYVELGSTEGWADLIVGRQILAFGTERVIGPSDWLNSGRNFDAVRLDIHQVGYKVSLFASSIVVGVDGAMDHHLQGNDLYGVYSSFKNVIPAATLEPYVLWRLAPANAGLPETANRGHLNETTIGLRLAGVLPAAFDYDVEMDRQAGSLGPTSIRAWAGYWNLGRTFRSVPATPRIFIESNYASGTKDPSGHTWDTFDQIYPSNHDKLDFADQFGRKNIQQARAGVEETIGKKWKLRQTYESLWLATTHDALYASSGAISIPADPKASSRHIGQEVDVSAQYEVAKGVTTGFGYARLFSGRFLKAVSPGKDYGYPFVYLTYGF
jgi:Alginate export